MGLFDAASLPSGPTSQGTVNSSIASWAQPYINNYLTGAQNLVNQGGQPNSLMQQSYTGAANLQTPGQFGQGTEAAQQGVTQALGAGQNYASMATDPNTIAAYMSPYIQQSLAPQLSLLNQQQALGGQNIAANAVGKGAFGGNRETLAQGLNAQNYDLARQSAIGQGYNNAFNAATQAQQYGAGLGLQGAQSAIQGAQTLGQLGSAQNQANLGILNAQNQFGQQQYNLPYQNLQFLQSMMQGLPYSNQQQQGWQAPPNALSQSAGLLGSAITGTALANKMGLFNGSGNNNGGNGITTGYTGNVYDSNGNLVSSGNAAPAYNPNPYVGNTESSSNSNDGYAKGGAIKEKRYASGGLATLAMHNATKGYL